MTRALIVILGIGIAAVVGQVAPATEYLDPITTALRPLLGLLFLFLGGWFLLAILDWEHRMKLNEERELLLNNTMFYTQKMLQQALGNKKDEECDCSECSPPGADKKPVKKPYGFSLTPFEEEDADA